MPGCRSLFVCLLSQVRLPLLAGLLSLICVLSLSQISRLSVSCLRSWLRRVNLLSITNLLSLTFFCFRRLVCLHLLVCFCFFRLLDCFRRLGYFRSIFKKKKFAFPHYFQFSSLFLVNLNSQVSFLSTCRIAFAHFAFTH